MYPHDASRLLLERLCEARNASFEPTAIYQAIETDDVLAAGVARLLLFTDSRPLPAVGEVQDGWDLYERIWRPGRPHPDKWPANYARAVAEIST